MSDAVLPLGSSLELFWEKYVELLGTVHEDLTVYPIRPDGAVEIPLIFPWFRKGDSGAENTALWRDDIPIRTFICVEGGSMEFAADLMHYADCFRKVITPALWPRRQKPLEGACVLAERGGFAPVRTEIGGVPLLAIEFECRITLTQFIEAPNP